MQFQKNRKRCTAWYAAIFALVSNVTPAIAQDHAGLFFRSLIQINQRPQIVSVLVTDQELEHLLYLNDCVIFPEASLVGSFYMENTGNDTMRLAPPSRSILEFLKLNYRYKDDSISQSKAIPFKYVEVVKSYPDTTLPTWGKGSLLPPHCSIELDASCPWDELSKLSPSTVECFWSFDNSSAANHDSSIVLARYHGKERAFKIELVPENRQDSLYSLIKKGRMLNSRANFPEALSVSAQILELDSTNYFGLEVSADVLWKLGRFDEALAYATKGKTLLESAVRARQAKGMLVTSDDAGQFIDRMNFFIDKCQKREKWKGAK